MPLKVVTTEPDVIRRRRLAAGLAGAGVMLVGGDPSPARTWRLARYVRPDVAVIGLRAGQPAVRLARGLHDQLRCAVLVVGPADAAVADLLGFPALLIDEAAGLGGLAQAALLSHRFYWQRELPPGLPAGVTVICPARR
jgi:hypothetical protein